MQTRLAILLPTVLLFAGCDAGGGGAGDGGGTSAGGQPAYVNGTSTGQYTSDDLGFFLGAKTTPATITTATVGAKLNFDIGNGFTTNKTNVAWRVLQNGVPFASGTVSSIAAFGWSDVVVPIPSTAGSFIYRIEIDPSNVVSEANENNNWVELTVTIAAPA